MSEKPEEHGDRTEALRRFIEMLSRMGSTDDATWVLTPEATALAEEVKNATSNDPADLPAQHALGYWHWRRYILTDSRIDLENALRLLKPLAEAFPEAGYLADFLQEADEIVRRRLITRVGNLVDEYESRGELDALRAAIALLRQVVADTPDNHPGRGSFLFNLGGLLGKLFAQVDDLDVLDEGIRAFRLAVVVTSPDDPEYGERLSYLSTALRGRFESTQELSVLEEAIVLGRQALVITHPDHPDRGERLSLLSGALQDKFEWTGNADVLDEAVQFGRQAVDVTPVDHVERGMRLSNLGNALRSWYERVGSTTALDEAVHVGRQAVDITPIGHSGRGGCLSNLGLALNDLYQWNENAETLDEAIGIAREAVTATQADDPALSRRLSNLGVGLTARFQRTERLADIDEAIAVNRRAVAAMPANVASLTNLGAALWTKFAYIDDPVMLDEAIAVNRRAMNSIVADHSSRSMVLSNLGVALHDRFERFGNPVDIDEAIGLIRQAVAAAPVDDPDRRSDLSSLSIALRSRFERFGDVDALEEAAHTARQALADTPVNHPDRRRYLSNLSVVLLDGSERTLDTAMLDEAIEVARQAFAASPGGPERRVCLSSLAIALRHRFERTGNPTALAESLRRHREVVAVTPDGHQERCGRLSNLSGVLKLDYDRTGNTAVLEEAIQVGRQAVGATPSDHPDRGMYLSNLCLALNTMSERTSSVDALDEAIECGRQAVGATAAHNPALGQFANNLGNALQSRFERTRDIAALDEAIEIGRLAVDTTAGEHPNLGLVTSNLSIALRIRYIATGELDFLDEAIRLARLAVAAIASDHLAHCSALTSLGSALRSRFDRIGGHNALNEARACFLEAWGMESASAELRVSAAQWAVDAALVAGDVEDALTMAERAVDLLGLVTPRRLRRTDRRHRMVTLAGLASSVATAAVAAGQDGRAVELLEQARGRLITDTLDTRSDMSLLQLYAPDLAVEFSEIRDALDVLDHTSPWLDTTGVPDHRWQAEAKARERLLAEWEQILTRVRAVPALSRFLLPPRVHELRQAATHGTVVYVVVHAHGSHAVILNDPADQTSRAIALPALTEQSALQRAAQFHSAVDATADPDTSVRERVLAQAEMLRVLEWLWDAVTRPVLDHLGHTATPPDKQPWPRVHWCPVGIATHFPLHAAGYHTTTSAPGHANGDRAGAVMDRVVSSYTPTARALLHTLAGPAVEGTGSAVIVAVPDAPGTAPLPGVTRETALLQRLVPAADIVPAPGRTTTRDDVLGALPDHEIAHFACHGIADWTDPATSRLVLHDHQTHPFTVADIAKLRLPRARLAYLSACSTADTNPQHADEATHLASAFQLAGYLAVIGTLWPISDRAATTITQGFYARLTSEGATPPDVDNAAIALHHITRHHRDAHPDQPGQWASHIHGGR